MLSSVKTDGRMDDLRLFDLFNSNLVISGRWDVDNERLCAIRPRLHLREDLASNGA